ncbi:MAG: fibronectin type III domain-containing protein, partial [Muribaculaceae bacterium]|nr:fibronectin type III domain-containing protein [Muribaculaceae bacterium]
ADTVWPHSWNVTSAGVGTYLFDDKILDRYACSNEWEGSMPDGIGTFVHEFSHVLGLPDIYPTSYTEAFTPGDFCVMDHGSYNNDSRTPPNYSIFERNALGWMKPVELTGQTVAEFTVTPIENMDGYVILTNRADEFFLIENRQLTGWDKYLPGHGMLVWHIDYNSSAWTSNTVNNDKDHQCIDIVEADDIRSTESRGGDPFPGTRKVTDFTHRTSPAMKTWAGLELKVPLRNIREIDGNIVFDGGYIPVPAPGAITALEVSDEDVSTTSFTARWTLDANSSYYLVNVYNSDHRIVWNNRNVGNTDNYLVAGLKPDQVYYFTVTPCNEDANGAPSNEVAVYTLPPTLDFLKTAALEASEVGDTYFTANWEPLDIATDYILNVYRQEATPLIEVYTGFDGGIAGLLTGWRTNASGTTDDPALCGESAPALLFDKTGYLLSSTYPESIKKVYFHLAVKSAAPGARLSVKGMVPGSYAWKEIDVIELDGYEGG